VLDMVDAFNETNNQNTLSLKKKENKKKIFMGSSNSESMDLIEDISSMFDKHYPAYFKNLEIFFRKVNCDKFNQKESSESVKKLLFDMISFIPKNRPSCKKIGESIHVILQEYEKKHEINLVKKSNDLKIQMKEEDRLAQIENNFLLYNFVTNKKYRPIFREFLLGEFSKENLEFLEEVEKFRELKSLEKRIRKSKEIYQTFIIEGAKYELNLSSKVKSIFEVEMKQQHDQNFCDITMLDGLFDHVIRYCMDDSYCRFQMSDEFKILYQKSRRKSIKSVGELISSLMNKNE
jgi:hypothetical protein